jgi:hypothetical protein
MAAAKKHELAMSGRINEHSCREVRPVSKLGANERPFMRNIQ